MMEIFIAIGCTILGYCIGFSLGKDNFLKRWQDWGVHERVKELKELCLSLEDNIEAEQRELDLKVRIKELEHKLHIAYIDKGGAQI